MRISVFFTTVVVASMVLSISIAAGPSLVEEPAWEQAKAEFSAGKTASAGDILEKLLKKYPNEADVHLLYAMASLKLGDATRAEIHSKKAVGIDSNHVDAWTFLGWLNLEVRKDYAAATEAYKRVVDTFSDSPTAHNNLGVAYKKNGQLALARSSFNRAIALKDSYAEAWSNRGWVYFEEENWPEARRDFKQALELNGNDEGALYGLSRVSKKIRDYRDADAALRQLISQSPNFVYWLEWVQVQLVWRYWVLLLLALGIFGYSKFRKMRAQSHGS